MPTIFVIDDDNVMRMMAVKALQNEDYMVYDFDNGSDALEAMEKTKPDLVITDILMPDMDGIEVMRELKTRVPDCKIIAMSTAGPDSMIDLLDTTDALGASYSFSKPLKLEELTKAVNSLLKA